MSSINGNHKEMVPYSNNNNNNSNVGNEGYRLLVPEDLAKINEKLQAMSTLFNLEQDEGQKKHYYLQFKAEVAKKLEHNLAESTLREQAAMKKIEYLMDQNVNLEIDKHKLKGSFNNEHSKRTEADNNVNRLNNLVSQEKQKRYEAEKEIQKLTDFVSQEHQKRNAAEKEIQKLTDFVSQEHQKRNAAETELTQTKSSFEHADKKRKETEAELAQAKSSFEHANKKRKETEAELTEAKFSLVTEGKKRVSLESQLKQTNHSLQRIEAEHKKALAEISEKKTIETKLSEANEQIELYKKRLEENQGALTSERAKRAELERKIQNFVKEFSPK